LCCPSNRSATGRPPLSPAPEPAVPHFIVRPIACYVSDSIALNAPDRVAALSEKIRAAVAAGADWIQIREKEMCGRDLITLARAATAIATEESGGTARVIVNDRLDVALASGANGVHLGGDSMPVSEVVAWRRAGNAPREFLIGVSCHSAEDVRAAEEAGADYVFLGPIFSTPSKRRFGAPLGVQTLANACRSARIPIIAIGGIDGTNATACLKARATGIAAIRMFQEKGAAEIGRIIAEIKAENSTR
jgi:thiamine-phosphate pyrophosphorylase